MRPRLLVIVLAMSVAGSAAQQAPPAPTATAAEVATYEAFRAWITKQPPAIQNEDDAAVFARYAAELRGQGKSARDIDAAIASLKAMGDRAEVERWNRILTAAEPRFNTAPNAFLVSVTTGLKPGRSLDVGMGQGRNTIYLAQQGWESAGFDPADRAVAAARRAFRAGEWSRMAPRSRMEVLYRFAGLIDKNAERLAVLETLDMGKPISLVVSEDLPAVMLTLRFMAECIDKIEGAITNTDADAVHLVLREPLGVVGAITPWNYPMLMAIWKVAPALAAGNSVVLKPAEQSPMSALLLAQLFVEAGGPAGVFNVVNGMGETAGRALALHNDVAKISFTGSTETGKLIMQYAGQSNLKRVGLECGGKSPQIFMADTPDLARAVAAAYNGVFANMGEVCSAGSRLLVERPIYHEFIERFIAEGRDAYRPGEPLAPDTHTGTHTIDLVI